MPRRSSFLSALALAAVAAAACSSAGPSGAEVVASSAPTRRARYRPAPLVRRESALRRRPWLRRMHVARRHGRTGRSSRTRRRRATVRLSSRRLRSSRRRRLAARRSRIVDAQDDPNAEADLGVYRAQYGLPACTTANGCFKKVNQNGVQGPLPHGRQRLGDGDLARPRHGERRLSRLQHPPRRSEQRQHADLGAGVNEAATLGATAISNSYGGAEDRRPSTSRPSTSITPASSSRRARAMTATARASRRPRSTSSPSAARRSRRRPARARLDRDRVVERRQRLQRVHRRSLPGRPTPGCTMRVEADVSAVADPNTGVAVYDSYGGTGGWIVVGGTSASSPLVAAIFALTGKRPARRRSSRTRTRRSSST